MDARRLLKKNLTLEGSRGAGVWSAPAITQPILLPKIHAQITMGENV
jgi:hypothetical protein